MTITPAFVAKYGKPAAPVPLSKPARKAVKKARIVPEHLTHKPFADLSRMLAS